MSRAHGSYASPGGLMVGTRTGSDEAVAVGVDDAARVECGAAPPEHDAAQINVERQYPDAVRHEDVRRRLIRRSVIELGMVVVGEGRRNGPGEKIVARARARVRHA